MISKEIEQFPHICPDCEHNGTSCPIGCGNCITHIEACCEFTPKGMPKEPELNFEGGGSE